MNFKNLKNIVKNKQEMIWILFISFVLAFLFTSNSPFYRYDTFADSAVYTTVGHSWLAYGMIPYKDVFDHKGPLHFLIFGIGSLFRINNSYTGIYIIESIFFAIGSYFYYKTANLFIKSKKSSLLLTTLVQLVLFSSVIFVVKNSAMTRNVLLLERGGTPEEICLPFISIMTYLFLKNKNLKKINFTNLEWMLLGFVPAAIFFIKFSISIPFIILYFGLLISKFIHDKKGFVNAFKWSFITFICPFIIFFLYFKLNGAMGDFVAYYFKANLFNYSDADIPFLSKLLSALTCGFYMLSTNYLLFVPIILALFAVVFTNLLKWQNKVFLLMLIGSIFELSLLPNRAYSHYLLPVMPIILTGLIFVFPKKIEIFLEKSFMFKMLISFVLICLVTLSFANEQVYLSKIGNMRRQKDTSMEEMAKIIKKDKHYSKDTTILHFYSNNVILYTLTNTRPNVRFFYRPAMNIDQYEKETLKSLREGKFDYIYSNGQIREPGDKRKNIYRFLDVVDPKLRAKYKKALKKYKIVYAKDMTHPLESLSYFLLKKIK